MDPTEVATLVGVAIGSGGIGGVVVQYISRASERRGARAKVLAAHDASPEP